MVPIHDSQAAAVVGKVQSTHRGNIGEPRLMGVQETAVSFVAAP